jgi:hypothetical protein
VPRPLAVKLWPRDEQHTVTRSHSMTMYHTTTRDISSVGIDGSDAIAQVIASMMHMIMQGSLLEYL